MSTAPRRLNAHTRKSFVRKSVEFNSVTEFVVDSIMPYYPRTCRVIGGYVSVGKQYWKVNFHWEFLLGRMDKALSMELSDHHKKCIRAIRAVLVANSPSPSKGYTASRVMGQPQDLSGRDTVVRRWKSLMQCKRDFKSVMTAAKLLNGLTLRQRKVWLLAIAPVARPGRSKHSSGYAVDLYGNNAEISKISKSLGASLVFPEGSHVHVEFGNGVAGRRLPKAPAAVAPAAAARDPADEMCLLSPAELADLRESTRKASATGDFSEEVGFLETIRNLFDDSLGEDWW